MSRITASILIIGNEILSGRTQDINIQFIAKNLLKTGIILKEVRIVADVKEEIINNLNKLRNSYNYVFTTGGIGPTHDDITSESVSSAFGRKHLINDEAYKLLENHYPKGELNEGRIKMTKMPEGSKLIHNPLTIAPGFTIENVYVLPGIPKIMQIMFLSILNTLNSSDPIISETINTNLYESIIAKDLENIQKNSADCEIGSYPHFDFQKKIGGVNIVISGINKISIDKVVDEIILTIKKLGGNARVTAK